MSFLTSYNPLPAAPGLLAGALGKIVSPTYANRSIGGIIVQATIEEVGVDTLTITDHPVEIGAKITDHCYLNPIMLDIEVGFGGGILVPMSDVYKQFLDLQASRNPFDIITGKRVYKNMLLQSITQTTDRDSENSLGLHLHCQQVILVSTSVTTQADATKMAKPSATAPVVNTGSVNTFIPKSIPTGIFSKIAGAGLNLP
jgi:hypothetical protein